MSRGYRNIIVAAFGWLILVGAASHADPKGEAKQAQAQQSIASTLENISAAYRDEAERAQSPDKQAEPCQPGDDRRYSDLCAQWKAADAASDSAWWAWASGLIGVISLAGVAVAIALAYQANRISRDTARRQLRPYVSIDPVGVFERDDSGFVVVGLLLHNAGQTPAYDIFVHPWFATEADPARFAPNNLDNNIPRDAVGTDLVIPPGQKHHVYNSMPFSLVRDASDDVAAKKLAIVHYGFVTYRDGFGGKWRTNFAHYHRGPELTSANAKRCYVGNGAT